MSACNSFDEMIDDPHFAHGHNTIALAVLLSHIFSHIVD